MSHSSLYSLSSFATRRPAPHILYPQVSDSQTFVIALFNAMQREEESDRRAHCILKKKREKVGVVNQRRLGNNIICTDLSLLFAITRCAKLTFVGKIRASYLHSRIWGKTNASEEEKVARRKSRPRDGVRRFGPGGPLLVVFLRIFSSSLSSILP